MNDKSMKNNLQLIVIAVLGTIFICAISSFGQVRTGGYKAVPTDNETVIDAAEFAANTQSEKTGTNINIETIETAARQIVAGTNYKLCLQVAVGEENEKPSVEFIQAIVFYSLQQEFSLKSWTKVSDCS